MQCVIQGLTSYSELQALAMQRDAHPTPPHHPDWPTLRPAGTLLSGTLLKEAIEDLEWPNSPVVLAMQRDPQRLTMRATGVSGSLEVGAHIAPSPCPVKPPLRLSSAAGCSGACPPAASSFLTGKTFHGTVTWAPIPPVAAPPTTPTPQVELPVRELLGFSAAAQHVAYTYAYRNLRAAFSNIPTPARGEPATISTKVGGGAPAAVAAAPCFALLRCAAL
jgi:hypothetical protein